MTHDCPEPIAAAIVGELACLATPGQRFKLEPENESRTRNAFRVMFEEHKPKLWIFGHWHVWFDQVIDGTRFLCIPELAFADVDTETFEVWRDGREA